MCTGLEHGAGVARGRGQCGDGEVMAALMVVMVEREGCLFTLGSSSLDELR